MAGDLGLRHIGLFQTIVAGSTVGSAVVFEAAGGRATLSCCDLWGNAGGDWTSRIASQYGIRGNISADPQFCTPDSVELFVASGSPCAPSANPACGLIGAWGVGCEQSPASVAVGRATPRLLLAAAPNPFAGRTEISFSLTSGSSETTIDLDVYDLAGRLVRRLQPVSGAPGQQNAVWDGRDSMGRPQPGGVYFVRLGGGKTVATSQLVLLRQN